MTIPVKVRRITADDYPLEVKKLIQKRFRGDIQFEIADDNTVSVRVIPRDKIRY